jgi:hypothetical protein
MIASFRKTERTNVMTKLTQTLTQSGLLAVLLEHQRSKAIELAQRRAHRAQLRAALWSTLIWPWRALMAPKLVHNPAKPLVGTVPRLESFTKPVTMSQQIRTYPELRQQIHDDLRIQHPEWVEPNGESSMRLVEQLDVLTRRGSNESLAAIHRALGQGTGR